MKIVHFLLILAVSSSAAYAERMSRRNLQDDAAAITATSIIATSDPQALATAAPAPGSCPVSKLPALANGVFTCAGGSTYAANRSTCTGTCSSGFTGSPTVTCINGNWSAVNGSCTAIITGCLASNLGSLVTNGASWDCSGQVPKFASCLAKCKSGYIGTAYKTCNANGAWGSVQGSCYLSPGRSCSTKPPSVSNSAWSGSCPRTANSVCYGQCTLLQPVNPPNPGYWYGQPTSRCNNGVWSSVQGLCTSTDSGVGECPPSTLPAYPGITWLCTARGAWNGWSCQGVCASGAAIGGVDGKVYLPCSNGVWGDAAIPGRYVGRCPSATLTSAGVVAEEEPLTAPATSAAAVVPAVVITESG